MIRAIFALLLAFTTVLHTPAGAQDFRALARVLAEGSHLQDDGREVALSLALTQAVPYRLFLMDAPRRLVIDFREVNWAEIDEGFEQSDYVTALSTGRGDPGWSRMVLELDAPMQIDEAGMQTEADTGAATVTIRLSPTSEAAFAEAARHPPHGVRLPPIPVREAAIPGRGGAGGLIMVTLDPGHGGVDPGAQRSGVDEADLMLEFALELRDLLLRSGRFDVVLTREGDWFVSLPERVTIARAAGSDLFLSLHADALAEGVARGATIYTLSETASDAASAALAEAHDRADLLAGVDLTGSDDEVTEILFELARLDTAPRSEALAEALVAGIREAGGLLHRNPHGRAGFSVLKAADIPSALVELGYMSDPRDLENLRDPVWRRSMQEGLRDALLLWADQDAARAALARN